MVTRKNLSSIIKEGAYYNLVFKKGTIQSTGKVCYRIVLDAVFTFL